MPEKKPEQPASRFPERSTATEDQNRTDDHSQKQSLQISIPEINLPKGGGAVKSIDEKFQVNSSNGTASLSIPLPVSAARNSFSPNLNLSYSSGSGNSAFGMGWNLNLPKISRQTDKGLPRYFDETDSDTYLLSDAEDLVPFLKNTGGNWQEVEDIIMLDGDNYKVKRYRPRIEGNFSRIERWTNAADGHIHWKTISKDNISTLFGKTPGSRITDPTNSKKIFQWLPWLSYDDKGNCMLYEYKDEDLVNTSNTPSENHRQYGAWPFTNKYPERIKYGTKKPYDPSTAVLPDFMFETVFDYNESPLNPDSVSANFILQLNDSWTCRKDPFSTYKSCFEIRTYRLCYRILHFHHFTELGAGPTLVNSLDLNYHYDPEAGLTFLESTVSKGYLRNNNTYTSKELPPFSFYYEKMNWDTAVKDIPADQLSNLPNGIDDAAYQWVDLYSEGISGILSEQEPGLFYKRNLGNASFENMKLIVPKPSLAGVKRNVFQLQELEADGRKFMTSYAKEHPGYFELTEEEDWLNFKNFRQLPTIDLKDPNIKFIDLNGDGKADLLVNETEAFCWLASKGTEGFDDYRYVRKEHDEEKGPVAIFNDGTQSIILADINGDGLTDIVRVRNSEIAYWPNMGYGRFGAKVVMNNSPWLDSPELFNPKNIRLADINGSGIADLIYLTGDSFKCWFNLNGNSWGELHEISPFPEYENSSHVTVIDLLGHGTSCIVWSSPLPGNAGRQMRYIDLMKGVKPFVLNRFENNMGKRVSLQYKPSTYYYLEDKKAGNHWITKLPFPVQCVDKTITEDLGYVDGILKPRLRFTQQFSYHHGYFDYHEKEFRGFGRVEQTDTEDFDHFKLSGAQNVVEEDMHEPPVKTITWFHTGCYFNREKILQQFAGEYTKGPFEFDLPEPAISDINTPRERREAFRAFKGMPLRKEVYSLDKSADENIPYSASYHSCLVRKLQPGSENVNAVFFVLESEAVSYNYERKLADPRIGHTFNLEINEFGNILQSASVVYGRKLSDPSLPSAIRDEQQKIHISFTEHDYTNSFDQPIVYRICLPSSSRSYELTGFEPGNNQYFTRGELLSGFLSASEIAYEQDANPLVPQKKLTGHTRIQYLSDDLVTPLAPGQIDTLGFAFQTYQLAFTIALITDLLGTSVTDVMLLDMKYVHLGDTNWWVPSGRNIYIKTGETFIQAQQRFFQPVAARDSLNNETNFLYDPYFLILKETEDPVLSKTVVEVIDYKTLRASVIRDVNDNLSEVITDELGRTIISSVSAMETTGMKGDSPASSYIIIEAPDIHDVINDPQKYLQEATRFFYYDQFAFITRQQPVCIATIMRETHVSELEPGQQTNVQLSVSYSGGSGQNLQSKVQAEPGTAFKWSGGNKIEVDTGNDLRWVGNGRLIMNNKGKPVKQYDPYFSTTYEYESEKELVEIGYSSILHYDPMGRNIRTAHPDGSFSEVKFDSWKRQSFDENDTILNSSWYSDRGSPNPLGAEPADPEQRAAWLAAKHANTFAESHSDSLGRDIYTIADNGPDGKYASRVILDGEGNQRSIIDAKNHVAMEYRYNMLGQRIYQKSMDAGENRVLSDTAGNIRMNWNGKQRYRSQYDGLNRSTENWLMEDVVAGTTEKLIGFSVYGEGQPNDKLLKLRGKLFRLFDQSGMAGSTSYDFKGNLNNGTRQLAINYKQLIDWNIPDPLSLLEAEVFSTSTFFDALNRPIEHNHPDGSRVTPFYNEATLVEKITVFHSRQNLDIEFIKNIDYNAKGQRLRTVFGNNTAERHDYDERTHRLTRSLTTRNNGADILQDNHYTYDPSGNITEIRDDAQQTVFFNNALVEPDCKYYYDALYRLKKATGREHAGQNQAGDQFDKDKTHLINGSRLTLKGDMGAMQRYEQSYEYDEVGNILKFIHNAGNGALINQWTRTFIYRINNNQLESSSVSGITTNYNHDGFGNLLNLVNGNFNMSWDHANQLRTIDLGGGGDVFYVYNITGQRIRKVIENGNLVKERIYIGDYEIYRERQNNIPGLERETLHVMDGDKKIAFIETRTAGNDPGLEHLTRYQYGNHLGSVCLEMTGDANSEVISYEEYYPYGNTAYSALRNQTETNKRYKYSGKEKDEESGLYYYGSRYYACWLAGWLSIDPKMDKYPGMSPYNFVLNNPVKLYDPDGKDVRLSVDQKTHTITYSTTIHFFGTADEIKQLAPSAKKAEQFYANPAIETKADTEARKAGTPNATRTPEFTDASGTKWTVKYDVKYKFHDTAKVKPAITHKDVDKDPSAFSQNFAANQQQLATDIGFQPGDNILTFEKKTPKPGVVKHVTGVDAAFPEFGRPDSRMVGYIRNDGKSDSALTEKITHETGHMLGFDERYYTGIPMTQEGFDYNFMTYGSGKTEMSMAPTQIDSAAQFGIGVANGRILTDQAIHGVIVDSTRRMVPSAADPNVLVEIDVEQFDKQGNVNPAYTARQTLQRNEVVPHFRTNTTGTLPPPPPPASTGSGLIQVTPWNACTWLFLNALDPPKGMKCP